MLRSATCDIASATAGNPASIYVAEELEGEVNALGTHEAQVVDLLAAKLLNGGGDVRLDAVGQLDGDEGADGV